MSYDKSIVNQNQNRQSGGMDVIVGAERNIGIQQTGRTVQVPSDPWGKLMYYLSCVHSCLDCIPDRYRNYGSYWNITNEDREIILKLCVLFSPDKLLEFCFIPVSANAIDNQNTFFKITDTTRLAAIGIDANRRTAAVFEGQSVEVHTFMVFKEAWLDNYYINPIKAILQPTPTYTQPRYVAPTTQTTVIRTGGNYYNSGDSTAAILVFVLGFCFMCIWLGGFAYIRSPDCTARTFGILSVFLYFAACISIIVVIVVEVEKPATNTYNNCNNYYYYNYYYYYYYYNYSYYYC